MRIFSFGIKKRTPDQALSRLGLPTLNTTIINATYLPNPFSVMDLRGKNGLDPEVIEWLEQSPETAKFLNKQVVAVSSRKPAAIGVFCVGGHHRSVYVVEQLHKRLRKLGVTNITTTHMELGESSCTHL